MTPNHPLFTTAGMVRDFLENKKRQIELEIKRIDEKELLKLNEAEFTAHLCEKFSIVPPDIFEDKKTILGKREIENRGLELTLSIPFTGSAQLLNYTPTPYSFSRPCGEIDINKILINIQIIDYDEDKAKTAINAEIGKIKEYAGCMKKNIEDFNKSLTPIIRDEIKQRKRKIQKDLDIIEKIGIPLKRHDAIPEFFVIPVSRKKPIIKKPKAEKKSYKPEPILEMNDYEDILNILKSMNLEIERSPKTFSKLLEEELRDFFIVILNSHFEGQTTGETFNYSGKTDILIRYEEKNVFIAECKFWRGEKKFLEAIDQLLGYKSWRDTKTAIILFNRDQNFSAVLEKASKITKSHPCYKKDLGKSEETIFKYLFHHSGDVEREFYLTVMAFNIPKIL